MLYIQNRDNTKTTGNHIDCLSFKITHIKLFLLKLAKFYLLCNVSLGFQFQNNSLSNCFACIRYAFIRLYCHFIVTTYTAPLKIHLLTIAFLFIIFPLYFNFHASKAPIICIPRYKFNQFESQSNNYSIIVTTLSEPTVHLHGIRLVYCGV